MIKTAFKFSCYEYLSQELEVQIIMGPLPMWRGLEISAKFASLGGLIILKKKVGVKFSRRFHGFCACLNDFCLLK